MESAAEIARMAQRRKQQNSEDAEKSGETILDLVMFDHATGLGGRALINFQRRKANHPFPWHRFSLGS